MVAGDDALAALVRFLEARFAYEREAIVAGSLVRHDLRHDLGLETNDRLVVGVDLGLPARSGGVSGASPAWRRVPW